MWKNSHELLASIKESLDGLRAGEIDIKQAQADARLFVAASRIMAVQLEHAKATGRLGKGKSTLPVFTLGDEGEGAR